MSNAGEEQCKPSSTAHRLHISHQWWFDKPVHVMVTNNEATIMMMARIITKTISRMTIEVLANLLNATTAWLC